MKIKTHKLLIGALACFTALAISSCSEKSGDAANNDVKTDAQSTAFSKVILAEEPKEASSISDIRKNAKPGDKVTFKGNAIGAMNIFMADRAVMILGDPEKMTSCNLRPDDECKTPWDVCCDDEKVIKANIITLRYLDESGEILKEGFKNVEGIKELSSLVVSGTVADETTDDNMIVNVSGVYVKMN